MLDRLRPILGGIKSYIPGLYKVKGTGGTNISRYCYSVWLRHIGVLHNNGMIDFPEVIAELGPGDSLGIGLAGLISGVKKYYALDVVEHAINDINENIFEELVKLFYKKEEISGDIEFPRVKPKLKNYRFPDNMITKQTLNKALNKERILNLTKPSIII